MDILQEKDLLDQTFADGGEAELGLAIEFYGQPLLRYCHNILCDYHEAQDAVQVTFLKAYENRTKYRNGTSLSAWLYRIAYHTCIDTIRRKKLAGLLRKDNRQEESSIVDWRNQHEI